MVGSMLRRGLRFWDLAVAGAISACAGIWLPDVALTNVTAELITFFGIQSAVVLPAMIFTAGVLRPDGLTLPEARAYQEALKRQMLFWIVLLALDFLTVAALIFGKATGWAISFPPVYGPERIDLSWLLAAFTAFVGSLAVLRTIPFIRGVLSLQSLNGRLTEAAIAMRDKETLAEFNRNADVRPFKTPDGFGKVVGQK